MKTEGTVDWKAITTDEVRRTAFTFHQVHQECGMVVHIERGHFSLVCWCEHCKDLQAYEIEAGQSPLPAA